MMAMEFFKQELLSLYMNFIEYTFDISRECTPNHYILNGLWIALKLYYYSQLTDSKESFIRKLPSYIILHKASVATFVTFLYLYNT